MQVCSIGWMWDPLRLSFGDCRGLPLSDRGFRFGMHIFETIIVKSGRPLLFADHVDSFLSGCRAAGFPEPDSRCFEMLPGLVANLPDGMLRIFCTAGDGAPGDPVSMSRMVAFFEPATIYDSPGLSSNHAILVESAILSSPWVKSGNYWSHISAQQAGAAADGADALLVSPDQTIRCGAVGNCFFVIDGCLVTPPDGAGVRLGCVRSWILEHFPHVTRVVHRTELLDASECFLSNSRIGVRRISRAAEFEFPESTQARSVWDLYRSHVLTAP